MAPEAGCPRQHRLLHTSVHFFGSQARLITRQDKAELTAKFQTEPTTSPQNAARSHPHSVVQKGLRDCIVTQTADGARENEKEHASQKVPTVPALVPICSRIIDGESHDHCNSDGGEESNAETSVEDAIKEIKHAEVQSNANGAHKTKQKESDWRPLPDEFVANQKEIFKANIDIKLALPMLTGPESERDFGNSHGIG